MSRGERKRQRGEDVQIPQRRADSMQRRPYGMYVDQDEANLRARKTPSSDLSRIRAADTVGPRAQTR